VGYTILENGDKAKNLTVCNECAASGKNCTRLGMQKAGFWAFMEGQDVKRPAKGKEKGKGVRAEKRKGSDTGSPKAKRSKI